MKIGQNWELMQTPFSIYKTNGIGADLNECAYKIPITGGFNDVDSAFLLFPFSFLIVI